MAAPAAEPMGPLANKLFEIVEGRADPEIVKTLGGLAQLQTDLKTSAKNGLTDAEVEVKRREYGANKLPPAPFQSLLSIMWKTIQDKTLIMLLVAAVVSIILGVSIPCKNNPCTADETDPKTGWVEGTAILFAVIIVVMVTSLNDYSKEAKFRKLNAIKEDRTADVIRNGALVKVSIFDVVVGDIMKIATGDLLCADGVFLEGAALTINESSATGESEPVKKGPSHQQVFLSGTEVLEGTGTMMVVQVGEHSFFGRVMMAVRGSPGKKPKEGTAAGSTSPTPLPLAAVPIELDDISAAEAGKRRSARSSSAAAGGSNAAGPAPTTPAPAAPPAESEDGDDDDDDMTPLQIELAALAEKIGKIGLAVAIVLFVVLVIKELITLGIRGGPWDVSLLQRLVHFLITSITIVVVAVPEGLPLAVTLALAFSMMRMIADHNLVRVLAACEVMGGATAICSDKTGTLTQNKMTVVAGVIAETQFAAITEVAALTDKVDSKVRKLFIESCSVNSTASEIAGKEGPVLTGNSTEVALLTLCKSLGGNPMAVRESFKPFTAVFPFSSKRKRMSTMITDNGKQRIHTKGASEIVLAMCTRRLDANGNVVALDGNTRTQLQKLIGQYADRALRTISVAYYEPNPNQKVQPDGTGAEEVESELVLIGIVGIQDPVRPEVPGAVKKCQVAGITVRMVTGDNIATAKAIAIECGIYNPEKGVALEGPKFRAMTPTALKRVLPRLQVLARSSPLDKQLLVRTLQEMGEVVAVTGDGTNDAPALSMADVGFAMGIAGTEVAKEASSIILMDDNFASIVRAVLWGRNVFDSVRKFLQFQVTINIVAVTTAVIGALSSDKGESPLTPVQLLWVNLVMDTLAALALATEAPTEALLERKPYGRKPKLITNMMWKHIIGQGIFQLVITLVLLYGAKAIFQVETGSRYHTTLIFNIFVVMQLFNEINCRRIYDEINMFKGVFSNWIFVAIWFIIVGVQILLVTFGAGFTQTDPLPVVVWVAMFGISFLAIPVSLALRFIPVPADKEPPPYVIPDEPERNFPTFKHAAKAVLTQVRVTSAFRNGRAGVTRSRAGSVSAFSESSYRSTLKAQTEEKFQPKPDDEIPPSPAKPPAEPIIQEEASDDMSAHEPMPPTLNQDEDLSMDYSASSDLEGTAKTAPGAGVGGNTLSPHEGKKHRKHVTVNG